MADTAGRARWRSGGARAALRAETVRTVALLAHPAAFRRMRRYRTFGFTDHHTYLRQVEAHLRALAGGGGEVRVALFDPDGFAAFCARRGLAADRPASRARYVADQASVGPTVRYAGQQIGPLTRALLAAAERRRTWQRAGHALAAAGDCAGCGRTRQRCAGERAAGALAATVRAAGPGTHHLVCTVFPGLAQAASPPTGGGRPEPLSAALHVIARQDGPRAAEPDALLFCAVLGAALATRDAGGLVLRTVPESGAGSTEVRGWRVWDGWLWPLKEAEVFAAYCTDVHTGEPQPPEPGVTYRGGDPLPPPACHGG